MTAWKLYMKNTELGMSGIKKGIDNMKIAVRRGTFETNSSSVHSLVICSEETYNKWVAGKVTYSRWQDKFSEACEITEEIKQKAKKKYEANKKSYWRDWDDLSEQDKEERYLEIANENKPCDSHTYEEFTDDYNVREKYFTTGNGDTVVAVSITGYDG